MKKICDTNVKSVLLEYSFLLIFLLLGTYGFFKTNLPIKTSLLVIDTPIRVLVLKHSKEKMADDDAKMVVDAVESAKKELDVQVIGNHFIHNKTIKTCVYEYSSIDDLKNFINEQIKESKLSQDCNLIIFTVGHGSPSGSLDNLGPRAGLQKVLAEVAEENDQKILWWQLSCYAAAKLPPIDSLSYKQQQLFSVLNASDEKTSSPAYIEGKIMEKMFASIISDEMDKNKDQEIDGYEFKEKMNEIKKGRGDLFRTHNMSAPLFGVNFANRIPIWDVVRKQAVPKGFIPVPKY